MKSFLIPSALLTASASLLTAAEPANLGDTFNQGRVSRNARLRYEGVQQIGLPDANTLTLYTHPANPATNSISWQSVFSGARSDSPLPVAR